MTVLSIKSDLQLSDIKTVQDMMVPNRNPHGNCV